jgi:hypothetical protein
VIPSDPIGSIPRPRQLVEGVQPAAGGEMTSAELEAL